MKVFIFSAILAFAFVSCKKNSDNVEKGTSDICFDTTSLRINITEAPQSIFFVNARDGFLAGYNGGIYKTTDSAKLDPIKFRYYTSIYNLFFTDAQTGFCGWGKSFM